MSEPNTTGVTSGTVTVNATRASAFTTSLCGAPVAQSIGFYVVLCI